MGTQQLLADCQAPGRPQPVAARILRHCNAGTRALHGTVTRQQRVPTASWVSQKSKQCVSLAQRGGQPPTLPQPGLRCCRQARRRRWLCCRSGHSGTRSTLDAIIVGLLGYSARARCVSIARSPSAETITSTLQASSTSLQQCSHTQTRFPRRWPSMSVQSLSAARTAHTSMRKRRLGR